MPDPWAKREAWRKVSRDDLQDDEEGLQSCSNIRAVLASRNADLRLAPSFGVLQHPIFSTRSMISGLFPGLGIAIVTFGAYVLVDNLIHPANVEELKRTAKEAAARPSMLDLLKGKKVSSAAEGQ